MKFLDFKKKKEIFRTEQLGDGITRIRDVMDVGMYLVEGEEKAALIDSGLGIGDVRPLVNLLTDKPVDVYLTHGHVDHGGGIYTFDRVFVTREDRELLRWHTKPRRRLDFAATYDPTLHEVNDIFEYMPYRSLDVGEMKVGQQIDLGGRILTVVDLRGHTTGSVGFFDDRTRTLFAGDGCNNSTFLFLRESISVTAYRQMLLRLKQEWEGQWKRILICHGDMQEAPLQVVDDLIDCCERVIEGRGSKISFILPYAPFRNGTDYWAAQGGENRMALDGHYGNLIYCAENI